MPHRKGNKHHQSKDIKIHQSKPATQAAQPQPEEERNPEEQAEQRGEADKEKEKEGADRGKATVINLTNDQDKEEEVMVPPSSLETCLEEAMKHLEDADKFHRQGMILHKHIDKINKEAWDKLEAARRRVKICVTRYLQPAQNKLTNTYKEDIEVLQKKHKETIEWLKDIVNVKDDDRRRAIAQSKALQEQLNKQQEEIALAKEQERTSRESQQKLQKLYEEARKEAQALPRLQARISAVEKDREKAITDKINIAKEKGELFKTLKDKNEVITTLQHITESWRQAMEAMKEDTIKSKTTEELLTQENKLLKQQEGEDEDVLLLTPQAKDTLVQAVTESLGPTWDKALAQMYQMKQEVVSMAEQGGRSGQDAGVEELQGYKDEVARLKRALEEASSSTTARAPVPDSAKEKYWEKEASKYRQLYQETNEKYKAELPSAECIRLIRETTLENQKMVADNGNLKEEISQLKEYKAKMSKFGQEQRKYVQDLELSIDTKQQQQLNERKKSQDYPATEDFAMEAEVNYETDLLEQAKMLQDGSPDAFKPTLKITYENFKIKGQIKAVEQQLHKVRADAELIRNFDDDTLATGREKLARGELVLMNRKLQQEVQKLLRTTQMNPDFELYRTAAHVLTSEYAKYNTPLPEFYCEAQDLLCKVWEEPLPHDHPYSGKLFAYGPKGQNRCPQ